MKYNLERKIRIDNEAEYKSLYPWSLQECDQEGQKVGADQIPWIWGLYFTASDLRYSYSIDTDKFPNERDEPIHEKEIITGILHSGLCRDGECREDDVLYSMFGTDRSLKFFKLRIQKIKNGDNEKCELWGFASYTDASDFILETSDDIVEVNLFLSPQRFDKISELIKGRHVDILEVHLGSVDGFYSEWNPFYLFTHAIKILVDSKCHEIPMPEGCEIEPPRLGNVGAFRITMTQRNKLMFKQDLRSIDIDKLFEESDDCVETFSENQETNELLTQSPVARNESFFTRLRIPLWLIFMILCLILAKL